jgi:cytochrome c oxidase subunit III
MNIGTIETVDLPDEEEKKKKPRTRLTGGSGPSGKGGGKNGGGGGGGGDRPNDEPVEEVPQFVPQKSRLITGFLLIAVMMTFAGLIAAYVVIATNGVVEWRPFDLPIFVWISTGLILTSSITYHLAKRSFDRNDQEWARKWLIVTTVLGATFISSQLVAWLSLVQRGLYLYSNPYAGFFYVLTGLHAIHVLGGIIALGSIFLRAWVKTSNEDELLRRRTMANVVGWYWHFMGALWVVIFVLLGFWR